MLKIIKKADIILFIILVIVGLGLSFYAYTSATSGSEVVVKVRGVEQGRYKLNENRVINLNQHSHSNKITIKDGFVQMTFSDCKNQVCVHEGKISKTSQTIVCLPNRVTIEIVGGSEYDAISK